MSSIHSSSHSPQCGRDHLRRHLLSLPSAPASRCSRFGRSFRFRAIVRLALPNVPQAVFYALQGQLALFLITYLGHTKGVASVGALARLGQLFAIFLQMNPLLTEPYFARLPKELLRKRYAIALLVAAVVCSFVAFVASAFPQLFLWLLGPQYSSLQLEVKLAIATGAVAASAVSFGAFTRLDVSCTGGMCSLACCLS